MRDAVREKRRELRAFGTIPAREQVELQPIEDRDALPGPRAADRPFCGKLADRFAHRVERQAVRGHEARERQVFAPAESLRAVRIFADLVADKAGERVEFGRAGVALFGPRIAHEQAAGRVEWRDVHAAEAGDLATLCDQHPVHVHVPGIAPFGKVEHLVIVVRQPGVDRIPLNPRFEQRRIGHVGARGESVAHRHQLAEVGQQPFARPALDQGLAQFVEFEHDDRATGGWM